MPQGRGAREEGAEALHRVLAADAGGEGLLAGWLVGPRDTVFSNCFPSYEPSARVTGRKGALT